jgi:hypothetical protein
MRYAPAVSSNKRAFAGAVVGFLLAASAGGWWGWSQYQKREQGRAILAAVQDTTARLRDTLAVAPNATGKRALGRIDQHVAAVDANLKVVRDSARRIPELADGAEHYVLGAREILKRQAASIRQSEQSAASRAALVSHMRRAARRDGAWIREAMLQKKIVEGNYFDYNLTLGALADLLKDFPETAKRLTPLVDPQTLLERKPADEARALVLKESRRVTEELESVRRLTPR